MSDPDRLTVKKMSLMGSPDRLTVKTVINERPGPSNLSKLSLINERSALIRDVQKRRDLPLPRTGERYRSVAVSTGRPGLVLARSLPARYPIFICFRCARARTCVHPDRSFLTILRRVVRAGFPVQDCGRSWSPGLCQPAVRGGLPPAARRFSGWSVLGGGVPSPPFPGEWCTWAVCTGMVPGHGPGASAPTLPALSENGPVIGGWVSPGFRNCQRCQ